jgi:tetratricopeptide (TPR) repeat protein
MVTAGAVHRRLLALALAGSTLFALRPASAQPVVDQTLADAQLAVQNGCAILKVNFNIRIRYADHFPLDRGDELRITVNPIDRNQAAALALLTSRREAATVPDGKLAGIKAIDLETHNPAGPVLRILFDRVVAYQVAPSSDTHSIVVAIAGAKPSATCQPIFPEAAYTASPVGDRRDSDTIRPKDRSAGTISDSDLRAVAAWMDEGRAALKRNNLGGAIQLFTKVLKYPENQYSAEAQELLGLAHQKGRQLGEARAEYEDFLRRYPNGEQSERVRQRLAGIVTAIGEPSTPLHAPNGLPVGTPPIGKFAQSRETTWTLMGSASTFYIRDDSFRTARDPSVAPDPNADPDEHAVHQNETLSTLDLVATWNNDQTKGKIRFSGAEEHRFNAPNQTEDPNQPDETGVSALSVETLIKDWNLSTVFGRQTLNADGMLGRFDGALFSWQALPLLKVDLVGGSPASSRYDVPFKNERYFYGAGIGLGPYFGGWETTLYVIEQRDRWLVDREAVGSDFRYVDLNKFAFGNVDYDIRLQQLNAAIFSASWTLLDKSTIYGGADYRRTPYLSTWNALLNQPFATLYDMLKAQSETSQQLQQLVIDQTPIYKSAMLGFSHPLSDKLQIGADATIVNLTQPISQIGMNSSLLATLPAGNEYYYSLQLIGNNIIKDGDMYIGSLRYSQQPTLNEYVLDFNTKYPLTNDWLLGPRLRLGYDVGKGTDLKQYTVLPSILIDYYWTRDLNFELEVGAQWTSSVQSGIKTTDTELLATIGLRYSFHVDSSTGTGTTSADDRKKLVTPAAAALCRYSPRPDGSNCMSPSPGSQ